MLTHSIPKGLLIVSLVAVIMLPAYTVFFLAPSFNSFIKDHTEDEAVRVANYLEQQFLPTLTELQAQSLSSEFGMKMIEVMSAFDLIKLKIFSATGLTLFSSAPEDIGKVNNTPYFHNIVSQGSTLTKIIKKDRKSLEGQTIVSDVVETYVPIHQNGNFIGAFEIYYDISHGQKQLDSLMRQFYVTISALTLTLLSAVIFYLLKHNKALALQKTIEEELRQEKNFASSIVEVAQAIIMVLDSDENIIQINPFMEELSGFKQGDVQGRKWSTIFQPGFNPTREQGFFHGFANGGDKRIAKFIRTKSGEMKMIEWSARPLQQGPGTFRSIVAVGVDITKRHEATLALEKRERYLKTIMDTIQTGVVISDAETSNILDVNPFFLDMVGFEKKDLLGKELDKEMIKGSSGLVEPSLKDFKELTEDCILQSVQKGKTHTRRSIAEIFIDHDHFLVQSFLDITDLKNLLKEQNINIGLARNILRLINSLPPRYIDLQNNRAIFTEALSMPCNAEGGDHYFIKTVTKEESRARTKTIVSLKDQSGHSVNCVLRSIITDLMHNMLIYSDPKKSLEQTLEKLNREICKAELFDLESFCTAVTAEIDHDSLLLRFVSNGHPPFIVLRGKSCLTLGHKDSKGTNLPLAVVPSASFSAGEYQLEVGDKIIFYTDGLTDMPLRKLKNSIQFEDFVSYVSNMISREPSMTVTEIMQALITKISALSGEEVVPFEKNTSNDDITLLGLEIINRESYSEEILQPKDLGHLSELTAALRKKLTATWKRLDYDDPENRLTLVLEEAILNAWKHGNREDPHKTITVRWHHGIDFDLEVIDQGEGFNFFTGDHDPTSLENVEKPFGRGIFIMKKYADFIRWKKKGRHIIASFRKSIRPRIKSIEQYQMKLMDLWNI